MTMQSIHVLSDAQKNDLASELGETMSFVRIDRLAAIPIWIVFACFAWRWAILPSASMGSAISELTTIVSALVGTMVSASWIHGVRKARKLRHVLLTGVPS